MSRALVPHSVRGKSAARSYHRFYINAVVVATHSLAFPSLIAICDAGRDRGKSAAETVDIPRIMAPTV